MHRYCCVTDLSDCSANRTPELQHQHKIKTKSETTEHDASDVQLNRILEEHKMQKGCSKALA